MENNYICEKHKKIIEERKPKCKYCELDELPDTSNRKWKLLSDKEENNIEATLLWKGKPIWKGNYCELDNKLIKLKEVDGKIICELREPNIDEHIDPEDDIPSCG